MDQITIDIDMRYDISITERKHTEEHIMDGIHCYLEKLANIFHIPEKSKIPVFIFEKDEIVKQEKVTKDGIHIIIGIKMNKPLQYLLRTHVMEELKQIWDDLPLQNTWDSILDEGITKGHVNWQLYGSRKPGCMPYKLTYYLETELDDKEWQLEKKNINTFDVKKNFHLLSVQNKEHISFPVQETYSGRI